MPDITLNIKSIKGSVTVPSSKSVAHRALILAALAKNNSSVSNLYLSEDVKATLEALKELGFEFYTENSSAVFTGYTKKEKAEINCRESGSLLRFIIPVAAALGINATFTGEGRLPERPITEFEECFKNNGVSFESTGGRLPLIVSGQLKAGEYRVSGNISSQFITGLLLALPLLDKPSKIIVTTNLESSKYVDITLKVLKDFGVRVQITDYGFLGYPCENFSKLTYKVEGDYSQAAFWLVAAALGNELEIKGLNEDTSQGDKDIINILRRFGADAIFSGDTVKVRAKTLKGIEYDCCEVPDLVPIVSVLGALSHGRTVLKNLSRLRYKESDRIYSTVTALKSIGADIESADDNIIINGKQSLPGGVSESFNDHRIAMALAVASLKCEGKVTIKNYECVNKSYPDFFEQFLKLGGK